jgi:hypothetical protein
MATEPRTIVVPGPLADVLDQLGERYAAVAGEPVESSRRLVIVAALQRGLASVHRELDDRAPAAAE